MLPKSTQLLVDAVSALWGTHIVPIRPELIISTNNTTEYIVEGNKDVVPKFVLATKYSILKKGTSAIYQPEDSKTINGMRVNIRNPVFGNRNHNYYYTVMNYWSVAIKVIR